ncbi:hypothetical protein, partial [Amycolatopsis solani]
MAAAPGRKLRRYQEMRDFERTAEPGRRAAARHARRHR